MNIVIAGGGSVGVAIAQDLLDRHHSVTLVEQRPEIAERLRGQLPGVNVVTADACWKSRRFTKWAFARPTS
jgi:Trk K+ transport system NAD-binding subunit